MLPGSLTEQEQFMLQFSNVYFSYPSAPEEMFIDLTFRVGRGWTGVVGPNGSGKSTLLQLAAGLLRPDSGSIRQNGLVGYCPQRTDSLPENFEQMFVSDYCDHQSRRFLQILGIQAEWQHRWATLSHGERKRAQLAAVLLQKPDLLLVDEPTNHLDARTAAMIHKTMQEYCGIGLLVCHDRAMLDSLCHGVIFVETPQITLFPGNYRDARQQMELRRQSLNDKREQAKAETKRLDREMKRRLAEASRSDRRMSNRHIDKHDSDMRARMRLARVTSKDATAGNLAAGFAARLERAEKELDQIKIKKEYATAFDLQGEKCPRNLVLRSPATRLNLGEKRSLTVPELLIAPDDRIGVTGPNGSGKSTLVRYLLENLDIPDDRLIYLPQEIDADSGLTMLDEIRSLPGPELGEVFSFVSCLGSAPARLLDTVRPSPGEMRKLLFALGLTRRPWLIIMDEPTNHLDLPAIELLENALRQISCALILVSHDQRFLENLVNCYFHCEGDETNNNLRISR